MKVGLFGGSFNPPHQGHLHISNLAIQKLGLHQVWWLPTAHNNFKEKSIYASYATRYQKCQDLTDHHPKVYLKKYDDIQTEKLIKKLQNKYPHHHFTWIMGADNLPRFHEWNNFKKLINMLPFAIFSRDNHLSKVSKSKAFKLYTKLANDKAVNKKTLPKFLKLRTKTINISSTQIRNNV